MMGYHGFALSKRELDFHNRVADLVMADAERLGVPEEHRDSFRHLLDFYPMVAAWLRRYDKEYTKPKRTRQITPEEDSVPSADHTSNAEH